MNKTKQHSVQSLIFSACALGLYLGEKWYSESIPVITEYYTLMSGIQFKNSFVPTSVKNERSEELGVGELL